MNRLLWVMQILLALVFLFAAVTKFVMPAEQLTAQSSMSATFLRFIGTMEVLGALGLVLPWLLRIRPMLTPLAAAGLVVIMVGAVVTTIPAMGIAAAIVPAATGPLAAFVAWGRWGSQPQPRSMVRKSGAHSAAGAG
jgi:hypothetical protein